MFISVHTYNECRLYLNLVSHIETIGSNYVRLNGYELVENTIW